MTNEELFSVAEIVERATKRFNEQAALHKVRCDQYDQLIADMKAEHETKMVEHRAAFGARTVADTKIIAGLREELNQVRNSLGIQAAKETNKVLGMVEGEGLRGAAERVVKERDALRAEVAALQERLRASIARGDFAQMERSAREPCAPPTEATHAMPAGKKAAEAVRDDRKIAPKPGDTVRLVRIPSRDDVSSELKTELEWPWIERWGTLNQTALVVEPAYQLDGALSVCLSTNVHVRWPISCIEVITEATHDTEAGKAAAEAAVKNELDELKVGDVVRATSWKAGKAALVKKILSDGRLMLDCSDQPWRVDEVVKLARKVTT